MYAGPGRKGLRKERDECRDLVKKRKESPRLESRRERWIERWKARRGGVREL